MKNAWHFVGFKNDTARRDRAVAVFGKPDFVHFHWDRRAVAEVFDGDVVVFADGFPDKVQQYTYDDSANV